MNVCTHLLGKKAYPCSATAGAKKFHITETLFNVVLWIVSSKQHGITELYILLIETVQHICLRSDAEVEERINLSRWMPIINFNAQATRQRTICDAIHTAH